MKPAKPKTITWGVLFPDLPAKRVGSPKPRKGTEKKPRAPDPLWDTIAELFFKGKPPTRIDCTRIGRVVVQLREVQATPEEIRNVYIRCGNEFSSRPGDPPLSLECLLKWFTQFRGESPKKNNGNGSRIRGSTGRYGSLSKKASDLARGTNGQAHRAPDDLTQEIRDFFGGEAGSQ